MNKIHEWVNTLLIVVVGILVLVGGTSASFGATGTRFPNGISADTTSPAVGQVRGTTLLATGATTLGSGSNGTAITALQFGTCNGITYNSLATSTPIECAVTGALTTDSNVLMWLPNQQTDSAAVYSAFGITGGGASTTAGYIRARIFQLGSFTGLAATTSYPLATTSIRYLILR